MKWQKRGGYYWSSDKGYKITKFRVGDEWKYSSFIAKGFFNYQLIGSLHNNVGEAKDACEQVENEKQDIKE